MVRAKDNNGHAVQAPDPNRASIQPPTKSRLNNTAPITRYEFDNSSPATRRKLFVQKLYQISQAHMNESVEKGVKNKDLTTEESNQHKFNKEETTTEDKTFRDRFESLPGVKRILDFMNQSSSQFDCGSSFHYIPMQCYDSSIEIHTDQDGEVTAENSVDNESLTDTYFDGFYNTPTWTITTADSYSVETGPSPESREAAYGVNNTDSTQPPTV